MCTSTCWLPNFHVCLVLLALMSVLPALEATFLTYQWNGGCFTALGKTLEQYQSYCHDENEIYHHGLHNNGMGAELFVYGQALCNCMQWNVSMNVAALNIDKKIWYWNDREFCRQNTSIYNDRADPKFLETFTPKISPLECYFNKKNPCHEVERDKAVFIPSLNKMTSCPKFIKNLDERAAFRAATIEYLFSNISRRVVNESEVLAERLFTSQGYSQIPKDMITVHVRWGDKAREMSLVPIERYLDTIAQIVANESIAHPHIHLVSESNEAATLMKNKIAERNVANNATWKFTTFGQPNLEARKMEHMAYTSHGRYGLYSLINLLIAMESKYYVITTASNWSRVINSIRLNIKNNICGNCTKMYDLQPNGDYNNW